MSSEVDKCKNICVKCKHSSNLKVGDELSLSGVICFAKSKENIDEILLKSGEFEIRERDLKRCIVCTDFRKPPKCFELRNEFYHEV